MDEAHEDAGAAGAKRLGPAAIGLLVVAALAVSVLAVLAIGGAVADRLEDDPPSEVTVTSGVPATTTEPESEVVLAPPVSIDNTSTTTAGG